MKIQSTELPGGIGPAAVNLEQNVFASAGSAAEPSFSARGSAGAIGGVVTALAIVVPLAIPTLDLNVFDGGIYCLTPLTRNSDTDPAIVSVDDHSTVEPV